MLAGLFQVRNVIFRHLPLRCPAHGRTTYSEPRLAMMYVFRRPGLFSTACLWGDGRQASVEPFICQRLYKIAHRGRKVICRNSHRDQKSLGAFGRPRYPAGRWRGNRAAGRLRSRPARSLRVWRHLQGAVTVRPLSCRKRPSFRRRRRSQMCRFCCKSR